MAQAKNSVRMSVDMPRDIYDDLVKLAERERSSLSRLIIIATAFWIGRETAVRISPTPKSPPAESQSSEQDQQDSKTKSRPEPEETKSD
jgi:hypothetical protein